MLERLLEEIKAKGFSSTLIQGESFWQCNIYLGSRLNFVCYCDNTPLLAVQGAWALAQELKPPEKEPALPDIDDLLSDYHPHNID